MGQGSRLRFLINDAALFSGHVNLTSTGTLYLSNYTYGAVCDMISRVLPEAFGHDVVA